MSRKALLEERFEKIKDHIMNPDAESDLNEEQQKMLDRWVYGSKILAKHPVKRNAVQLLMKQFPKISKSTAYEDLRYAERLFNVNHKFNKDFWFNWLVQDMAELIYKAKSNKIPVKNAKGEFVLNEDGDVKMVDAPDLRNWNKAHENLIRLLGDIPQEPIDPRLTEKHNIYIPIQINNSTYNIDLSKLLKMSPEEQKKLSRALQDTPIDDDAATEIMNS